MQCIINMRMCSNMHTFETKLIRFCILPYTFNLSTLLLLLSHLIICLRVNMSYILDEAIRFPSLFDDSGMIRFAAKHTHNIAFNMFAIGTAQRTKMTTTRKSARTRTK